MRVEVGEPGPDAADLALVLVEVVEPVVCGVEQRAQRREAGCDTRFWLTAKSSCSARSMLISTSAASS